MAVTNPGVVYTPADVAGPMVELALAPLVAGKTVEQILELRIGDPAVGEGAFLIEVIRVLSAAAGIAKREVAARCLRGADIDPRAMEIARHTVEGFVGARVPELRDHLRVGDSLAIDWPLCDAMVGNPPYIRQERLGAIKQTLRAFASYDGVADLYVYFIELAHRAVRQGGRYCLVVPNKWMSASYGRALRSFLARQASVERVVDFERGLFPGADAFPCIIAGTVGGALPGPIRASRAATMPVSVALARSGVPHARARWGADPWHIDAPGDGAVAERIAARWPALGDVIGPPSRGLVTGCNRAFEIDRATRDALGDSELVRPFLKGRDVRRWRPALTDRYVIAIGRGDVPPAPLLAHLTAFRDALEPGCGRKPGAYKWYELQDPIVPLAVSRAPRLFYQDIQTQPACCLDSDGTFAPDTTVWALPTDDHFVLAVLNSQLYGWYSRRRFPPALNGAVRPKRAYMRAFPLAEPSSDLRARIAQLVAAQLAEPTPERDAKLNALVYEAYELSQTQIALISAQPVPAVVRPASRRDVRRPAVKSSDAGLRRQR